MVFPYMDHDLCGLLANSDFKLTNSIAKLLMKQILQGMDYIHAVCLLYLHLSMDRFFGPLAHFSTS